MRYFGTDATQTEISPESTQMPRHLILERPLAEIERAFGLREGGAELCSGNNLVPGQMLSCYRGGPRLEAMRWGLLPVGRVNARGRPVLDTIVHARAETVFDKSAFEGTSRCIVPVDGWYEWTGEGRNKSTWRVAAANGGLLALAAICDKWRAPGGAEFWQVATVTCPPSADVAPYHDRMCVILEPDDFDTWLNGLVEDAQKLLRPWPDGKLRVTGVDDVDRIPR